MMVLHMQVGDPEGLLSSSIDSVAALLNLATCKMPRRARLPTDSSLQTPAKLVNEVNACAVEQHPGQLHQLHAQRASQDQAGALSTYLGE